MSSYTRSPVAPEPTEVASDDPTSRQDDPLDLRNPAATPGTSGRQALRAAAPIAISVIVPVRNDPGNLDLCLQALATSTHPDYEVIVVDDASIDDTAAVAQRHGVQLLRQEQRGGPAAARNWAAETARHPYLFFVDADVCVQPTTLEKIADEFHRDPSLAAVFGSYDAFPGAPNVLSQYRNLLHHFVHQGGNEEAFSFWSGCGAIRKAVFLDQGGFDVGYDNASVEDIELGSRLSEAGHRIALVKSIQVKHMKRWTLVQMIRTDIQKRAIPWTMLLLRQGKIPNDLNLRHSQRLSALCAGALVATLAIGSWFHPSMLLLLLLPLGGLLLIDRWSLHRPVPGWSRLAFAAACLTVAGVTLATTGIGRDLMQPWTFTALGLLSAIVVLNLPLYRFLAENKSFLFVLLVIPAHVLYYLYSSLAFAVGVLMHLTQRKPPADPRSR